MAIQLDYVPRAAFVDFHNRTQRFALMVCHRRSGKTFSCVNELVLRGLYTTKPNARFAYVAPFRQQAKEIAWTYLKEATKHIQVEPPRESELRVKLPNDVWITIYGADNPDSLRGLYFDGLILDEFGDMKPSLMGEVILPCLADRLGWLAIIGTAKGRNQFYDYYKKARNSKEWFFTHLKASRSGLIAPSELERLKEIMTESQYEQEMECSFEAALLGTYYADLINKARDDGRLMKERLYEPSMKVNVAADVGLRDSTAWWFWQPRADGIAVIDYHEAAGKHIPYYLEMLNDKGYEYNEIWLPHDAKAKTLSTRRSTVEQFRNPHETVKAAGDSKLMKAYPSGSVMPIRMVPKLARQHGIDAVRMVLPTCYFDEDQCEMGLDALRSYRRQWHEHSQTFSDQPLHNHASNGADGFRYLSLANRQTTAVAAEKPRETELEGATSIGQPISAGVGYNLEQLWTDHERNRRRRNIRI